MSTNSLEYSKPIPLTLIACVHIKDSISRFLIRLPLPCQLVPEIDQFWQCLSWADYTTITRESLDRVKKQAVIKATISGAAP